MHGPVDAVHLAADGRHRVLDGERLAGKRMQMIEVPREQRAAAGGHGRAESGRAGEPRLTLSACPLLSERISEMLDGLSGDLLEEFSALRHLLEDFLGR